MGFNSAKTVLIPCTTTVSGAITLPLPAGCTNMNGLYFRAWSDSGAVVFKFNGTADKTPVAGALPDGNMVAQQYYEFSQMMPSGATTVTAIALAGTPNFFLEIGTTDGC